MVSNLGGELVVCLTTKTEPQSRQTDQRLPARVDATKATAYLNSVQQLRAFEMCRRTVLPTYAHSLEGCLTIRVRDRRSVNGVRNHSSEQ